MYLILRWAAWSLAIMATAWLVPGINVSGFASALIAIIIIGLINTFIKPLLLLITLPINIVTLGFFTLIINALLLMLAGYLSPGFSVDGFWSAFIGSIVLSILGLAINKIDDAD